MKKILTTIVASLLACSMMSAQVVDNAINDFEYTGAARPFNNEISVHYGVFSIPQIVVVTADVLGAVFGGFAGRTMRNHRISGSIGAEYNYYLANGRISLGGNFAYENMNYDEFKKDNNEFLGHKVSNCFTIMPTMKAVWFNRKHVSMYSHFGIGATFFTGSISQAIVAVQIDPVCIDFGGARVRGFVDLGFGSTGSFRAGLRTCF